MQESGLDALKTALTEQIYDELRRQGVTQRQLAERLGRTSGALQNVFSPTANVTLATLGRVARALGLELRVGFVSGGEPAGGESAGGGRTEDRLDGKLEASAVHAHDHL